jgi:hypothetical protein
MAWSFLVAAEVCGDWHMLLRASFAVRMEDPVKLREA